MFHPDGPTFLELAEQALSSTEHGYDLLAPKFDHTPFRTPDAILTPLAEAAAELDGVDRALDVCCGTGAVAIHLRPHCERAVVGLDRSTEMLRQARRHVDALPEEVPVHLVRGDALAMPFEDAFDVAACCGAFGHILPEDQDQFAEQLRKVLRPGGRFLFFTRPMPPTTSATYLLSRGFNAAMHLRNALVDPPFVMFYLTFTLERARTVLERHGFELDVRCPFDDGPFASFRLVVASV